MKIYAVITGDIINFTMLAPAKRQSLIEDSEILLKSWIKKSVDAEIYRGDSFQVLFEDVKEALYRSIQLICWFKLRSDQVNKIYLGTKISIGIGEVSYRGKNVLSSDGEAFHLSGRSFDQMKSGELLAIKTNDESENKAIQVILNFVNKLIKEWTLAQAEVILLHVEGKTQQEIANELSLSQPSVNSRIKLSNWKEIEIALNYISELAQEK
ncbi:hypothetical protein [Pedobacter sp. CG_S7]|uniref:hypothetical protein n=1 Tax=Pedobacter sp. CG_S7 TaxID=3143930 RepID=UPI003399E181